jgi:hypothetical protein
MVVVPLIAAAQQTAVQPVPCAAGAELQLTGNGNVARCRLTVAADLLVDPAAGNATAPCATGSAVEFHPSGYLSYCERAAAAATFRGRAGRETRCRAGARLAFGEGGYLEYCS